MHPSLDSTLWRSCEYPFFFLCCTSVMHIVDTRFMYCAKLLAWASDKVYHWDLRRFWAALSAFIHWWAPFQQGGWSTQTGYHRVMLKTSHNDALVLLYWVNPSPTRQDKRDLWQEVLCWQFFLQLSDSLALLYSSECETSDRQAPSWNGHNNLQRVTKKIIVETFFVLL